MAYQYDYLLVGSGLFNAVFAYKAKLHGKRCLVIDKRPHLGGNVYCESIEGICVHRYGPHIFHTNNEEVWRFVNQFVSFNRFTLCPVANYQGRIFNLPFNMNTFYQFWGVVTPAEAKIRIHEQASSITQEPSNLEDLAISQVGIDIFNTLIKGYTEKQWGHPCSELPASIIRRIPVRFTYDNNYYNDLYQGVPNGGYNLLINGLLNGVECKTNCNYFDDKSYLDGIAEKVIYTGSIDEYFGYCLGRLDYRSLQFEDEILETDNYQGNVMVNYTDVEVPYNRIIEHKHFDVNNDILQKTQLTIITREKSISSMMSDPLYPVNTIVNQKKKYEYDLMAQNESNTIFAGRLGKYEYLNMDQIVSNAFDLINYEIKRS